MPASEGTLTVGDVALHLGVPVDERMTSATDAARQWVTDRRWTLAPDVLWTLADVHMGGVLYASALYQSRVTPDGMAGYDPGVVGADTYNLVWRAKDLIGADPGFG